MQLQAKSHFLKVDKLLLSSPKKLSTSAPQEINAFTNCNKDKYFKYIQRKEIVVVFIGFVLK